MRAVTHLAYPHLALDKFSGTDLNQDAESFTQLIEQKHNIAPGKLVSWQTTLSGKTYSSLLYLEEQVLIGTRTTLRTLLHFLAQFSDGRNKFWYRIEVERCVGGEGEEIQNFLHRFKRPVDKGWPNDKNGIEAARNIAERHAQARQRRQKHLGYSLKGLQPKCL